MHLVLRCRRGKGNASVWVRKPGSIFPGLFDVLFNGPHPLRRVGTVLKIYQVGKVKMGRKSKGPSGAFAHFVPD